MRNGARRPAATLPAPRGCRHRHRLSPGFTACCTAPRPAPPPSTLQRLAATFSSELLGPEGAAQFAWSPTGELLAAAGLRVRLTAAIMARSLAVSPCVQFFNPHPVALTDCTMLTIA